MGMSDVQVLRAAVERVTEILADRRVKVIQRGLEAKVVYDSKGVPKEVHVPYIPDNASTELIEAVQGFIDHEIGHVLDSDPAAISSAIAAGVKQLHNVVEDVFVEQCQERRFRGSAYNLDRTRDFFIKNCVIPSFSDPVGRKSALINCACRAWGGQLVMQKFMEDKWGLLEGLDKRIPDAFKKRLQNIKSSWEALELAKELKVYLTEPPKDDKKDKGDDGKGEPGKSDDPKDKGDKDKDKSDGDGDDKPKDESSDGDKSDTPDDKPKDDDKDGPDDDKKDDPEEEEGKSEGEGEDDKPEGGDPDDADDDSDDADDDTDDGKDASGGSGEGGDSSDSAGDVDGDASGEGSEGGGEGKGSASVEAGAEEEGGEPFMSEDEVDDIKDFDESVAERIRSDSLADMKEADYLIFSREFDTIAPAETFRATGAGSHRADAQMMEEEVLDMVGPMQKEIERLMAAKSLSQWESGRRSGRINASALHRLASGDDRIFRKKIQHHAVETAITLLVDASGSMTSSNRIGMATHAALALSMTLDRLQIPHEVIAFTTSGGFPATSGFTEACHSLQRETGRHYGRYERIVMPILKSFSDRLTSEKKDNFAWCGGRSRGLRLSQNVDGECVQYAAERLAARREVRKVMLVLSDGEPACPGDVGAQASHLKRVVSDLNRGGIETIGIGIQTRAVERFYEKSVVLGNLAELPTEVMRQLRSVLL